MKKIHTFTKTWKRGTTNICEDVIIHLAGKAHDIANISDPLDYYQVNTELTKQIFDIFLVSKARFFITIILVKALANRFL